MIYYEKEKKFVNKLFFLMKFDIYIIIFKKYGNLI